MCRVLRLVCAACLTTILREILITITRRTCSQQAARQHVLQDGTVLAAVNAAPGTGWQMRVPDGRALTAAARSACLGPLRAGRRRMFGWMNG